VPARLPGPPEAWTPTYAAIAAEDDLPWKTIADVDAAARAFVDPVLARAERGSWDPRAWVWR
jgi:hypothetical protein